MSREWLLLQHLRQLKPRREPDAAIIDVSHEVELLRSQIC